jgi:hypothetical protein
LTERVDDLLLLIRIGTGATVIAYLLVVLWMRIIRHIWPGQTVVLSICSRLLGHYSFEVLTYVILEHWRNLTGKRVAGELLLRP